MTRGAARAALPPGTAPGSPPAASLEASILTVIAGPHLANICPHTYRALMEVIALVPRRDGLTAILRTWESQQQVQPAHWATMELLARYSRCWADLAQDFRTHTGLQLALRLVHSAKMPRQRRRAAFCVLHAWHMCPAAQALFAHHGPAERLALIV